ncbi:MAG: aldo/keto reductase [Deltaproteobacteria bacterium]|nr:aldo/keto reductase [Deltaproteobacteria bacterium]
MPVFSCGGMRYQQSWSAGTPVGDDSQRNAQAIVDRAFEIGLNHFETARGYGTSEVQLGKALGRHPRADYILQTKVAPSESRRDFEKYLEESFTRLGTERIDLFAFHGLNNAHSVELTLGKNGCYPVADALRKQGRIGHIGFSTHGSRKLIKETIETGLFDYVNLHYYYVFQDHAAALEAARQKDMGVFIISPTDKGGRLQAPTQKLKDLCAPLSPMVFNNLFCLSHETIHTLSVGAARPSDFDEHLMTLPLLANAEQNLAPVAARMKAAYQEAVGMPLADIWDVDLPEWDAVPGGVNIRQILRWRNLVKAYDVLEFAKERYAGMTGWDNWVPGNQARAIDDHAILSVLSQSPIRDQIPDLLREAHRMLDTGPPPPPPAPRPLHRRVLNKVRRTLIG